MQTPVGILALALASLLAAPALAADLAVSVSDGALTMTPMASNTYNITVINYGPDTATDVRMALTLPTNMALASATVTGSWSCITKSSSPQFECTVASFVAGESKTFSVSAYALAGPGTASLTATVSSATFDGNPANNTATDNNTIASPVSVPTLTEWAMILLGVMLAGGAALHLHRRRLQPA